METREQLHQRVRHEQQLKARLRLVTTRLTEAEQERIWAIVATHHAGLSIRQIAATTGLRRSRIHQLLQDNEAREIPNNQEHGTASAIRQVRYLNNIVEQDHRAVKRLTRPMLGFKAFAAAHNSLVDINLMPMIKKRQLVVEEGEEDPTASELFYALVA
jgi:hypothetical protein